MLFVIIVFDIIVQSLVKSWTIKNARYWYQNKKILSSSSRHLWLSCSTSKHCFTAVPLASYYCSVFCASLHYRRARKANVYYIILRVFEFWSFKNVVYLAVIFTHFYVSAYVHFLFRKIMNDRRNWTRLRVLLFPEHKIASNRLLTSVMARIYVLTQFCAISLPETRNFITIQLISRSLTHCAVVTSCWTPA